MPLAQAVIAFDVSDYASADFDARRTKVYATTNVSGGAVVDTDGNKIYLGSGNATIGTDGTGSISVPIPGTGSNPASWQTTIHVDYPDRNSPRGRATRSFGPFTITASANLADLVPQQEVPAEYLTTVTAQLDAKVAEAEAAAAQARSVADIDTPDALVATLVPTSSGSATSAALSATYATVVGLGLSNGTDDTATLNALLATAGGKIAKGVPGQSYKISAPLVLLSGTTLDMTGCTVTLLAGSNCRMVQNASLLGSGARDTDIHIQGGYWDRGANAGSGFNLFGICLHRADRISVTDARFHATAGKYACYFVDVTEATAERLEFDTESDGLHITGPASRITVRDIVGTTHDDLISFTGRDYVAYELTAGGGDISHVLVENANHKGGDGNTVKLLPGAGKVLSNATVRGVKGTPDLQAVTLYHDTNQAGTTGGTIRNVTIEDVSGAPLSGIWVQVNHPDVQGLKVRNLALDKATGIRGVAFSGGGTITDALVEGVTTTTGYTGAVVHVGTGTTVTDLRLANVVARAADLGIVYVSGTVGALHAQGITQLGGSGGSVLQIGAGASVPSFDLDGLHSTAAYGLIHQGSSAIEMSVARVTSVPATVLARLNAAGSSLVLRADRVTGTASSFIGRSATQTVRAIGQNLRVDVSTLTPSAGDVAFNTNAALSCGTGPVIYTGTTWQAFTSAPSSQLSTTVSWYRCPVGVGTGTSQLGTGTLRLVPFIVPLQETISRLTCEVTTAGEAGSLVRLGIWSIDPNVGRPATLVLDAGTVAADTIGVKEITINQVLPPGQYALGSVTQNVTTTQPTLRTMSMGTGQVSRPTVGTDARSGWSLAGVTGALSDVTGLGDTGLVPLMYVRRSA